MGLGESLGRGTEVVGHTLLKAAGILAVVALGLLVGKWAVGKVA